MEYDESLSVFQLRKYNDRCGELSWYVMRGFYFDIFSQIACRDVFRRVALGLLSWRSHCCGIVAVIVIRRFSSEDSDVGCSGVGIFDFGDCCKCLDAFCVFADLWL
jgi:hypothetical protein